MPSLWPLLVICIAGSTKQHNNVSNALAGAAAAHWQVQLSTGKLKPLVHALAVAYIMKTDMAPRELILVALTLRTLCAATE